jgi:hypothetical protein
MKLSAGLTKRVLLPLLALLSLVSGFGFWWQARIETRADLSRKLVGRWAAEGQSDGLAAGRPMVLTGGVALVKGRKGGALSFDGVDGNVSVPNAPEMAMSAGQDFSVTAWIQPMHAETSFGIMSIVEKRKVGGILTARGFCLNLSEGRLACQIAPPVGFHLTKAMLLVPNTWVPLWKGRNALVQVASFIFVAPGPDLRDGQFHHVALTLDRHSTKGGKLFVDGRPVMTFDATKSNGNLANSEPLLIGTHPDTTLHAGFKGLIEDVRLYSRALSQAEIETAANQ